MKSMERGSMVTVESEREIESYLFDILSEKPSTTVLRQIRLGEYGIADLVALTATRHNNRTTLNAHVIEIKKDRADIGGLIQLCRYKKAIEINLTSAKSEYQLIFDNIYVWGVLFCKKIVDKDNLGFILAHMQNMYVYQYAITLRKGLRMKMWPGWVKGINYSNFNTQSLIPIDKYQELADSADNTPWSASDILLF